jgi:hypothetical protein
MRVNLVLQEAELGLQRGIPSFEPKLEQLDSECDPDHEVNAFKRTEKRHRIEHFLPKRIRTTGIPDPIPAQRPDVIRIHESDVDDTRKINGSEKQYDEENKELQSLIFQQEMRYQPVREGIKIKQVDRLVKQVIPGGTDVTRFAESVDNYHRHIRCQPEQDMLPHSADPERTDINISC